MLNDLAGVLTLSVVIGFGAITVVLWRNHRDRRELERARVPVPVRRMGREGVPVRARR